MGTTLVPFDRAFVAVDPAAKIIRPFYRSYADACLAYPGPLAGWTPTRTVTFSTQTGLTNAISAMADGDHIVYNGTGVLTISNSGGNGLTISGKSVATKAVIDLGNYNSANHVLIESTAAANYYGLWCLNLTNVWVLGGEFSSTRAAGLYWNGGTGGGFVDGVVHGCGGSGIFVVPTSGNPTINGCFFRWESFGNNQYPSGDPHGDGGGGYHEGLLSDGNVTSSTVENCIFMVYGHDSTLGSCVQYGDSGTTITLKNNTFYIKAANNLYAASVSPWDIATGLNLWGDATGTGNVCALCEVVNYAGRASFVANLSAAMIMTIQHGRAIDTNQNATFLAAHDSGLGSGVAWDTRNSAWVTNQDCVQRAF